MDDTESRISVKRIPRSMKRIPVLFVLGVSSQFEIPFINTRLVCTDIIEDSQLRGTGPRARNVSLL